MPPPPPPPPPFGGPPPPPSFGGPPPAPVVPAGAASLARPGIRIVARFLDGIILGIVNFAIIAAIVLSDDERYGVGGFSTRRLGGGKLFAIAVIAVVLSFVYEAGSTAKFGGTPMKRAFGMRVVDAATGAPVTFGQAATRWAVPSAAGILPRVGNAITSIVSIVSLVFLFTDSRRQTISDKAAKTVVVGGR